MGTDPAVGNWVTIYTQKQNFEGVFVGTSGDLLVLNGGPDNITHFVPYHAVQGITAIAPA